MSLLDILSGVVHLAQGIRLIIAAFKGNSKVIIQARKLQHSCQLYADCVKSIEATIRNNDRANQYANKNESIVKPYDKDKDPVVASLSLLKAQILKDQGLLSEINKIMKDVAMQVDTTDKTKFQFILSVVSNTFSSKAEIIQRLEADLMSSVAMITTLMMKDIWSQSSSLNEAILNQMNDVDAAIFWQAHFGTDQSISFIRFAEGYQQYLTRTFLFRRLPANQLSTLLKHTLLEDSSKLNDEALSRYEITISIFSNWLRRFGPMKETLTKSSVLSLPNTGNAVNFFQKSISRDGAAKLIETRVNSQGISAESLFVIRYSSDPANHFVISARSPVSPTVNHFPVVNGPLGYSIVGTNTGQEEKFASTLIECVQRFIIDKLFVPLVPNMNLVIQKDSIEDWNTIFDNLAAPLKQDHYPNVQALDKLADEVARDAGSVTKGSLKYSSFFSGASTASKGQSQSDQPGENGPGGEGQERFSKDYKGTKIDKGEIGFYLVEHGLSLLLENKKLKPSTVEAIQRLIQTD